MSDVFISYASEDRDRAGELATALGEMGWSVWWDRKIIAGQAYDHAIERELELARSVVVLWSTHSVASEWVKNEAAVAAERGVLVPAKVDEVRLPLEFRRKQTADLTNWNGETSHSGFQALCEGVAAAMGTKPLAQPPLPHRTKKLWRPSRWIAGILVAAAGLGLGAYLLDRWRAAEPTLDTRRDGTDSPDVRKSSNTPGADGSLNPHLYTLKNKNQVRLVGRVVKNGSNVHETIVRDGIEHNAWRYNRCYDGSFGHLKAGMPTGIVVIGFEISDQLPLQARVDRSDFADDGFNQCVLGVLRGQTLNAASSQGAGPVSYEFKFLPQ